VETDDAKELTLGVGEDNEVLAFLARPLTSRPHLEQPLDLRLLVGGVQIAVHAILAELQLVGSLYCQVRTIASRILQHYPAVIGRPSRNVVKDFLPECGGTLEVFAVENDGSDSQHSHTIRLQVSRGLGLLGRVTRPSRDARRDGRRSPACLTPCRTGGDHRDPRSICTATCS